MASNRFSSNSPDLKDVITALHSFEQLNKCRIILTIRSCGQNREESIWWEAKAVGQRGSETVPKLLASAQLSCGEANVTTMGSAILKLLYMLDFQLAEAEFTE